MGYVPIFLGHQLAYQVGDSINLMQYPLAIRFIIIGRQSHYAYNESMTLTRAVVHYTK